MTCEVVFVNARDDSPFVQCDERVYSAALYRKSPTSYNGVLICRVAGSSDCEWFVAVTLWVDETRPLRKGDVADCILMDEILYCLPTWMATIPPPPGDLPPLH